MKHTLELNCPDDRKFLNYWDSISGNDVVCEIVDGKLMLNEEEITLAKFVELVEQSSQQAEETLNAIHEGNKRKRKS
jgi:hypothetical protein